MRKIRRFYLWSRELGIMGAFSLSVLHILKKFNIGCGGTGTFRLKERGNRDFSVRLDTSDVDILEGIILKDKKSGGEYDFLFKNERIREAQVIIDAGANIGAFSLLADLYCKQAKIIAIEPEKDNFAMLVRNTERNRNTICLQAGLWKYKTKLEVCARETGAWGFFVKESADGNIKAVGIWDLMEEYQLEHIDVLKVDIEGSEIELLYGDCEWLEKVGVMVIETHDRIRLGATGYVDEKMKGHGFQCKKYGEDRVYYRNAK